MRTALHAFALLATLLPCSPALALNGPSSLWRLDDGSGAVALDSAGANPGAVSGGTAWVPGVAGGALAFDGSGGALTFAETFPFHRPGNQTLMLWARWDTDDHRAILWSRDGNGSPDSNRFHLFSGWLGELSCPGSNDGVGLGLDYREELPEGDGRLHRLLCATGIPAGPWHHIAITRRSVPADFRNLAAGTVHVYAMYVDGAKVSEAVDDAPALPTYAGPWVMGSRDGFMFQGALDEVAIYPRALTPEEIAERYQRGLAGLAYEAPAPRTCTSWDVAADFRLPPGQENPSADRCGTPVWSYVHAPTSTPDTSTYAPLSTFLQGWNAYDGLAGWFLPPEPGAYCGEGCLPMVGYNGSGGPAMVVPWNPYEWPARTVVVHPGYTQPAIVAFRAPLAGTVVVEEASFRAADSCGGGIDWAVQHGQSVLGSGLAFPFSPAGTFSAAVEVAAGDVLYARVGTNGDLYCDSTQVTFRLRQASVAVGLDVMPGSAVNPIKATSRGSVPAAILGAPGFDVASVVPASLVLAGAPVARPGGLPQVAFQDVNGDGRLDLVAHFPVPAMALPPGTTQVALAGRLEDGTAIAGKDAVRVIP